MQQATRLAVAIVGFTVTLLGVVMLVTPGPGWLVILFGLGPCGRAGCSDGSRRGPPN